MRGFLFQHQFFFHKSGKDCWLLFETFLAPRAHRRAFESLTSNETRLWETPPTLFCSSLILFLCISFWLTRERERECTAWRHKSQSRSSLSLSLSLSGSHTESTFSSLACYDEGGIKINNTTAHQQETRELHHRILLLLHSILIINPRARARSTMMQGLHAADYAKVLISPSALNRANKKSFQHKKLLCSLDCWFVMASSCTRFKNFTPNTGWHYYHKCVIIFQSLAPKLNNFVNK